MLNTERVAENLNRALHTLFAEDPRLFLLGEDILDPYGGAFKICAGLSAQYPDRILATPISEGAIVGIANGLALCQEKVIVEIMFGDFIALCFDPIVNFAAKSVSMYGKPLELRLIVRCPVGGNRGYGPTHSQSLQKHFIGIPHLHLFELSPLHDNTRVLQQMLRLGQPCIFFEDKVLYTQRMFHQGTIDDLFIFDFVDAEQNIARISIDGIATYNCLLIVPGGLVPRALAAARRLFLEDEIETRILVPSQLYPFALAPLQAELLTAEHVFFIEESTAGGTWGSEIAHQIYQRYWGQCKHPIRVIHSKDSIIPTALHLEKQVIVQAGDIVRTVKDEVMHA